ncbi:Acetamidase [Xylographa opegraphella]|nr:Acetamidase [Xylographa opegraphella]
MATTTESWREKATAKRESLDSLIPESWRLKEPVPSPEKQRDLTGKFLWQYLSDREIEITEANATEIVKHTTTGDWTAEEVTKAFCHRASLAHQIVNCLHEIFFDAAIESAKALDAYYAEHKAPIGPLHGLPISLKDQFHVKGVETTMGYVGWMGTFQGEKGTGREKVFESEMVRELRALGAVLYCKTSVPHTLMSGETVNNIIGYTWNPKNRNLSCGGSSGGEGALIGMKGSPLGFGTDIGGSIRIPAAFCGLYGIRPSSGRMPYEGMANSMDGQNTVLSVVGPLSSTVGGLRLAMKSLLSQQPWLHDPLVHEIPWREEQEQQIFDLISPGTSGKGGLTFGIIESDGVVTPHPPVRRAMKMVVEALERLGHKVVKWNPPSHKRGNQILLTTWAYDGGHDVHGAFNLSGEPMADQVKQSYGDAAQEQMNASQISATNVAKREFQKEYMEYWNGTKELTGTGRPIDAVIAPLAPFAAARPKGYKYYGYSTFVNLLDYPSCVIPVTTADQSTDVMDKDFVPLSDEDKGIAELYDAAIYDGAHVAVQLIGRRLQEEKVLAMAEYVGNAISGTSGHAAPSEKL